MIPILPFGAGGDYAIARSLRTRGTANAGLYRLVAATTNRRTFTLSRWFKLGSVGTGFMLWQSYASSSDWASIYVHSSGSLGIAQGNGGVGYYTASTPAVLRDPTAWYHLVVQVDTTDATAANRLRVWINGVSATVAASGPGLPALNADTHFNRAGYTQGFGYEATTGWAHPTDGLHAELHFVDGQLIAPGAFGRLHPATGAWVPIRYDGGYGGANGGYYDFRDASTAAALGTDYAGNAAHLNVAGVSITAGANDDRFVDTPTNNHATLNRLTEYGTSGSMGVAHGGLASSPGGSNVEKGWLATQPVAPGERRYFEAVFTATAADNNGGVGLVAGYGLAPGNATPSVRWGDAGSLKSNGGAVAGYGSALSANDVVMVAVDYSGPTTCLVWFGKNGSWFASGNPATGANPAVTLTTSGQALFPASYHYTNAATIHFNFGQRPYAHAAPTGFLPLCVAHMATPAIKIPAAHFKAVTDTGAGIGAASLGSFPNLLVAIKDRANANNWQVMDSVRGANGSNVLQFNTTAANGSYSTPVGNSVGYAFNAGTAPAANTQGTLPSTVCANPTAGFSVVGWTGTGTAGRTVGHGLGAAPKMIIVKKVSAIQFWYVAHVGIAGTNFGYHMFLNSPGAISGMNDPYYIGGATSATFSLDAGNANDGGNQSGVQYVAYCWTEIPGFSRIGSYAGNGAADGPFVWCGFRPRLVMLKAVTVGTSWVVYDAARNAFNVVNGALYPNLTAVEDTAAGDIDILANGFKLREGGGVSTNNSGETYLFLALAETPFKYANAR